MTLGKNSGQIGQVTDEGLARAEAARKVHRECLDFCCPSSHIKQFLYEIFAIAGIIDV
jgi:hypothetical protein